MARAILHFDLDAFYCAVEELYDDSLVGIPFAVGGDAGNRGVVASCSYAARMYGVRSAMPMGQAKRLCPELKAIPARHNLYGEHSREVMDKLHNLTPLVEQLSIDEAFLDVTGLKGGGEAIARELQQQIRGELSLPCSIGVASNKLLAKTANNIGKSRDKKPEPPCSIEIVLEGKEAAYLAELPIRELWGVGVKTAEHLHSLNILTIGDIAAQTQQFMMHHFGKSGYDMWRRAQGIDNRPVEPEREAKSVSKETTFTTDVMDADELRRVLRKLAEGVGSRLRKNDLSGSTIKLKLRYEDFSTITRQTTLPHPTYDDRVITDQALKLFASHWRKGTPVRLIGVGVSNLENAVRQLGLWETEETKRSRKLQSALDDLRDKFGDIPISRAQDMKKKRKKP